MCRSDRKEKMQSVGFIDFGKAYDRFNREALYQLLRMYDVGVNL